MSYWGHRYLARETLLEILPQRSTTGVRCLTFLTYINIFLHHSTFSYIIILRILHFDHAGRSMTSTSSRHRRRHHRDGTVTMRNHGGGNPAYVSRVCMPCMYALYVSRVCMSCMYALYVCLICMPYMYARSECIGSTQPCSPRPARSKCTSVHTCASLSLSLSLSLLSVCVFVMIVCR